KPVKEIVSSRRSIFGNSITVQDKVFITKYLALMLRVGTDLFKAIDILIQDFEKPVIKSFLLEIRGNLERGNPFYISFQNHPEYFTDIVVNLIKAAETSGNLENTLNEISGTYEDEAELKSKIISALVYPILLLFVSFFIVNGLIIFVVPKVSVVFESSGMPIPFFSRLILGFSAFMRRFMAIIIPLFVAGSGGLFFYFFKTLQGRRRFGSLLEKTPLVNQVIKKLTLRRFAGTLASLLRAGIPLVSSLEITASAVGDIKFQTALVRIAKERIARGVPVGDAFKQEGIFPSVVVNLISIGEKSGHIEEVLRTLADFYEKEADAALKTMVSILEPVLLMGVGLLVAFIAISVIVPIFQLVSQYN
ncbi:MAG: General secretion pathway protein F, partial [Parcubacteria group bacterium GW2011_GWF2_46_8]